MRDEKPLQVLVCFFVPSFGRKSRRGPPPPPSPYPRAPTAILSATCQIVAIAIGFSGWQRQGLTPGPLRFQGLPAVQQRQKGEQPQRHLCSLHQRCPPHTMSSHCLSLHETLSLSLSLSLSFRSTCGSFASCSRSAAEVLLGEFTPMRGGCSSKK